MNATAPKAYRRDGKSAYHEHRRRRPRHIAVLVCRPGHDLNVSAKGAFQFAGALPGFLEEVLASLETVYALSHCLMLNPVVAIALGIFDVAMHDENNNINLLQIDSAYQSLAPLGEKNLSRSSFALH
jgi:hypothetical protein